MKNTSYLPIAFWGGKIDQAEMLYTKGYAFWEQEGHEGWRENFLIRLGLVAYHKAQPRIALRFARQACEIRATSRPPRRRAAPFLLLGRVLGRYGKPEEGLSLLQESLEVSETAKHPLGICQSLEALAEYHLWHHLQAEEARTFFARAATLRREMGVPLPLIEARRLNTLGLPTSI